MAPIVESRVLRFARQSAFWRPHALIPDIALFQRRRGGRIAPITELSLAGKRVVVYNLHLKVAAQEESNPLSFRKCSTT